MGGEQTIVSVGLPEGNLVTGLGESEPRSYKKRVVAAIGGLALVGAAIGVGIGASSGVDGGLAEAKGPTYSADIEGFADAVSIAAGVKNGSVKGRADLNIDNVLTWNLRKLESHASGTIHINIGRSCDDLGSSLWDAETGPNPWPSVSWTSDSKGKSSGSLDLDDIAGAYSFAANLGHAVVFYSSDEQVLACGVLKPEGDYRKFGVRSELNGGFVVHQDEATAGEVLVSKDNVMTWGMFNLKADQTGVVSVLAGGDCSDPDNTLFTGEWQTDKWGIAQGELALDSAVHDFARVVDRAVAFRSADGAVVACDTLSLFVEKMNEALRAVRQELKDIQSTYESEGSDPTPPTTNEPITDEPTSPTPPPTHSTSPPLTPPPTDFTSSPPSSPPTLPSTNPVSLPPTLPPSEIEDRVAVASIEQVETIADTCFAVAKDLVAVVGQLNAVTLSIARASRAHAAAQRAVASGNATQNDLDVISNFPSLQQGLSQSQAQLNDQRSRPLLFFEQNCLTRACTALIGEIQTGAVSGEEVFASEPQICPKNYLCVINNSPLPEQVCSPFVSCINRVHVVASQHLELAVALESLAAKQIESEAAQERLADGSGTTADIGIKLAYEAAARSYSNQASFVNFGVTILERECKPRQGSVTLDSSNVLSWNLENLKPLATGTIKIHNSQTCSPALLGNVYAQPGSEPFESVQWNAPERIGPTIGSIDLSTIPGTYTFNEYSSRSVVFYDSGDEIVACGTLQPEANQ